MKTLSRIALLALLSLSAAACDLDTVMQSAGIAASGDLVSPSRPSFPPPAPRPLTSTEHAPQAPASSSRPGDLTTPPATPRDPGDLTSPSPMTPCPPVQPDPLKFTS